MKTSIKILKIICHISSILMVCFSIFMCVNIEMNIYHIILNSSLFIFLLLVFFIFLLILIKYKKNNEKKKTCAVRYGKEDALAFISLIIFLIINRDLFDHTIDASLYQEVGLLNFLLIFSLINIINSIEELLN